MNEAALLAARKDKAAVDMRDFDEAIDRLIAGLEKKRVMNAREREIVAYHEAGHALVASALPGLDPVHKISIVQRGFGALGYTMQLPLEDQYLMTRTDLRHQLAVLLGGRTAEEIALGEISTGAQNDLQRASDIARAMVTEWGMSDCGRRHQLRGREAAPLPRHRHAARARRLTPRRRRRLIDAEVKRIMTEAHDMARARARPSQREQLEAVTRRLLERRSWKATSSGRFWPARHPAAPPPAPETPASSNACRPPLSILRLRVPFRNADTNSRRRQPLRA